MFTSLYTQLIDLHLQMLSDIFHGHISVQEASWIDVDGPASIFYSGHFESLSLSSSIEIFIMRCI